MMRVPVFTRGPREKRTYEGLLCCSWGRLQLLPWQCGEQWRWQTGVQVAYSHRRLELCSIENTALGFPHWQVRV